jgi:hypothetical protein
MKRLLIALAFLMAPAIAHAAPITFGFTGGVGHCAALCDESLFLQAQITGSYTFDSNAIDQVPDDPTLGVYESSGGPFGIRFSVLNFTVSYPSVLIIVQNSLFDRYFAAGPGLNLVRFIDPHVVADHYSRRSIYTSRYAYERRSADNSTQPVYAGKGAFPLTGRFYFPTSLDLPYFLVALRASLSSQSYQARYWLLLGLCRFH